ncbi:multicopper oxidase [Fusarium heterosporum]|uniref:Multicopper oxidase n=1 Tax=Fusarium heterosporum TaxID=42747 RepID=A0A8H5WPT4_FUSHE|nr:multicopper oxidase [Fusarium heterosporum]
MAFRNFGNLPLELQIKIWQTYTRPGPAMHVFDICFPSWKGEERSEKAFGAQEKDKEVEAKLELYRKTVFLDRLDTIGSRTIFDPSMYHATATSRLINRLSERTVRETKAREDMNDINLPGRAQKISIPSSDVLMLRFREKPSDHKDLPTETLLYPPPIKDILENQWSPEIASALQNAKKIAIDVSETWATGLYGELGLEEIAFFACTIQKGLEVLYLVDECTGRCEQCGRQNVKMGEMQTRDALWRGLRTKDTDDQERPGDIVDAVSRRYVEARNLAALGWEEEHPSYVFACMMDAAIKSQQEGADRGKFQGVRILVVEDE